MRAPRQRERLVAPHDLLAAVAVREPAHWLAGGLLLVAHTWSTRMFLGMFHPAENIPEIAGGGPSHYDPDQVRVQDRDPVLVKAG